MGDPDGMFGYSATWLGYTERIFFADYVDTRILACPIGEQVYRVSPGASEASILVELDVAECNQTAYRFEFASETYEPIDGFSGMVDISVSMRDPRGSDLRITNGSESFGAMSSRLACKATFGRDYQDTTVMLNGLLLEILDYSFVNHEACNYSITER